MSNVESDDEFIDNSHDVPIASAEDDDDVEAYEEEVNKTEKDNVDIDENEKPPSEHLRHQPNTIRRNIFHDQQAEENVRNVVQHAQSSRYIGLGGVIDDESPPLYEFIRNKLLSGYGWIITGIIVLAYSIWTFVTNFQRALPLLIVECIILAILLFKWVTDKYFAERKSRVQNQMIHFCLETMETSKIAMAVCMIVIVVMIGVLIEQAKNLISLLGLIVFLLMSWATSYKPKQVNWRPVLSGITIQFILGGLMLRVEAIANAVKFLGDQITIFLNYTSAGAMFVYGYLADSALSSTPVMLANGEEYTLYPPFYFSVLSVLIFFSAFASICHYLGIIGWLVKRLGVGLALVMGTSPVETFNTITNMFLDQSQSPMLLKPALVDVTDSELHAIMTAGFASTAGSVLAAYISFGASATDLLAATVMSAPAALAVSKVIFPETKRRSGTDILEFEMAKSEEANFMSAAVSGASEAVHVVLNIGAQLIAITSLIAMINGWLVGIGSLIDLDLTFVMITSYIFYPFAWLLGVEPNDCLEVGSLLGTKIIVNEFVAYAQLGELIKAGSISARSTTIATFALCGFSNISSIGISSAGK